MALEAPPLEPILAPAGDADRKAFETLRAAAAFRGYCLARTDSADGPVTYYATRWGLIREMRSLSEVAAFLTQIGAKERKA